MKLPGPSLLTKSLSGAFVCAAALVVAGPTTADAQIFTNTTSNTIPSPQITQGPASLYPAPITVTGASTKLTNLTVSFINLSHAYPDDLDVLLVGPTGQNVLLMSDCGGSFSLNNVNLTFDDAASNSLPDETQINAGTYKPTNYDAMGMSDTFAAPAPTSGPYGTTLASLDGTNPNGVWRLYIIDDTQGNAGVMSGGWSLAINGATAVPEPSSLALGALALTGLGGLYIRRRAKARAAAACL